MSLVVVVGGLKIVVEDLLALITVMGETVGCGSLLCGLLTFRSCCLGLSGNVSQVVGQCIIQVAVVVLVLAPQLSVMSLPFTALLLVLSGLYRLACFPCCAALASICPTLLLLHCFLSFFLLLHVTLALLMHVTLLVKLFFISSLALLGLLLTLLFIEALSLLAVALLLLFLPDAPLVVAAHTLELHQGRLFIVFALLCVLCLRFILFLIIVVFTVHLLVII
mmetsp:Transcript_494/g.793  ORF Transcript_494/g.793 Transcript_494/m.793 type:complete len:222 (+) Transcript_494:772-1437(+)